MNGRKIPAKLVKEILAGSITEVQSEYNFTDTEKQALGMKIAVISRQRSELADKKKEAVAQFSAQDSSLKSEEDLTRNKILSGFEMRSTRARIHMRPVDGQKDYYTDTNPPKFIKTEVMLAEDYQQEMPGMPEPKKPEKPAEPPVDGEEKPKRGRKPKAEPKETTLGDLLHAAAAGKTLPRVPVVLDEGIPTKKLWTEFRKAAKQANWPETCIDLMHDQIKGQDPDKALETLEPHTIRPGAADSQTVDSTLAH